MLRANGLLLLGLLLGAVACAVTGLVGAGVIASLLPAEESAVPAWILLTAVSGVVAAVIGVTISPALAVGYVGGFALGVLFLDNMAHGIGQAFSSGEVPPWTPDLRLQLPCLVAFAVAWVVLALGGAVRARRAS